jgi:hypothetical protein
MVDIDPDILTYLGELFSSENMLQLLAAEKARMYELSKSLEGRKGRMLFCRGVVLETMEHYFADESAWTAIEKLQGAHYETAPVHEWIRAALDEKANMERRPLSTEARNRCKAFCVHLAKLSPPMQRIQNELELLRAAIEKSGDDLMLKGQLTARHWAIAAIREAYLMESTPKDSHLWAEFAPIRHDEFIDSDWTIYFMKKA